MYGNPVFKKLADFLILMKDHELSLIFTKDDFENHFQFDPKSLFDLIDTDNKLYLTADDLVNFLEKHKILIKKESTEFFILLHSEGYEKKMFYNDFLSWLLCDQDKKGNVSIDDELKTNFLKLLKTEIDFMEELIKKLYELKNEEEFEPHNIFHFLSDGPFITQNSLLDFFKRINIKFSEDDLIPILVNFDKNKDEKIDFVEFHNIIGFPDCPVTCLKSPCKKCRAKYCEKCIKAPCPFHKKSHNPDEIEPDGTDTQDKDNSKKKIKEKKVEPEQEKEEKKEPEQKIEEKKNIISYQPYDKCQEDYSLRYKLNFDYKSPYKCKFCNTCLLCNCNHCCNKLYHPIFPEKKNSIKRDEGINLFNLYLLASMKIEDDIEEAKKKVAINYDFNCEDSFRLFNITGSDNLYRHDISIGLRNLNIYDKGKDVSLFMKRNDLSKKGAINFEEFCDIVTPFEKIFREDVFNRMPNSLHSKTASLSENTKNSLSELFNLIIFTERNLNEMKKDLSSVSLDLGELFPCIKDGNNITHDDFVDYLKDNDLLNDKKKADLLFIRLDKDRDGEISPEELEDEIIPVW